MRCDPATLVRAAAGFKRVPREMQGAVRISLLCRLAGASRSPVLVVPANLTVPVITGQAVIGNTLSGSNGTWANSPTTFTYRWLSNGVAIVGATANTFLLTAAQVGTTITFEVIASNAAGSSAPATSAATSAVLPVASFLVTTTGAGQVLTITLLTVSASMTVDWGDASQNAYVGTGARTHTYAAAGTYTVQFLAPLLVTALQLSDAKATLNSNQIYTILNVVDFEISALKAGTFNSSDVSVWRPTSFLLKSMPAGYAGTFNSSDVSVWRPTNFYLYNMPAGYAGTFNSSDVSAWRPVVFWLLTMPIATFTIIITANGFSGWNSLTTFSMATDGLTQVQVNQILTDIYAAFPTKIFGGGVLALNGAGNAAPSGIFQANCPPTSGKETAFNLLNDPCTINPTKKWLTVTTN